MGKPKIKSKEFNVFANHLRGWFSSELSPFVFYHIGFRKYQKFKSEYLKNLMFLDKETLKKYKEKLKFDLDVLSPKHLAARGLDDLRLPLYYEVFKQILTDHEQPDLIDLPYPCKFMYDMRHGMLYGVEKTKTGELFHYLNQSSFEEYEEYGYIYNSKKKDDISYTFKQVIVDELIFMFLDYLEDDQDIEETNSIEPISPDLYEDQLNIRIVYLQKLGVIDFLKKKYSIQDINPLASLISAFSGIRRTTVQSYINPIMQEGVDQKNNPCTPKNNELVRSNLLRLGIDISKDQQ